MSLNLKSGEHLKVYQEKIKTGEIEKPVVLDPIEKAKANPKSLRRAINAKCYDCACFQRVEVTKCQAKDCPLHALRPWQRSMENES